MTAIISSCGLYRYRLDRRTGLPLRWVKRVLWVMLNPSTADAEKDDPTIRRCKGFAESWGMTDIMVGNLYAYRATVPDELWNAADPVGIDADDHLREMADRANMVVCAWGQLGPWPDRAGQVRQMLELRNDNVCYLRLNKNGCPGHPLYLPKSLEPQEWVQEGKRGDGNG